MYFKDFEKDEVDLKFVITILKEERGEEETMQIGTMARVEEMWMMLVR